VRTKPRDRIIWASAIRAVFRPTEL